EKITAFWGVVRLLNFQIFGYDSRLLPNPYRLVLQTPLLLSSAAKLIREANSQLTAELFSTKPRISTLETELEEMRLHPSDNSALDGHLKARSCNTRKL